MQVEIIIIGVIVFFLLNYTGRLNINKLLLDNEMYFRKLKEEDWDFLVRVKYGDGINSDALFMKRIKNWFIVTIIAIAFMIKDLDGLKICIAIIAGFLIFKLTYIQYKSSYKSHLHEIDTMLPYYLKGLEILIQHYTVPVAIGKSMNDAPPIFRDGLQEMINQINAGDNSIEPYMQFARTYPVRDSMRMMRLLYRLSLGRQERKQEQLMAFSRSISSLQQKARETKYRERLEKMEGKTTQMLLFTGAGALVFLLLAVIRMMNF